MRNEAVKALKRCRVEAHHGERSTPNNIEDRVTFAALDFRSKIQLPETSCMGKAGGILLVSFYQRHGRVDRVDRGAARV